MSFLKIVGSLAVVVSIVLAGCGDPTGNQKPHFGVSVTATVQSGSNLVDYSVRLSGERGSVTSILLTGGEGSQSLSAPTGQLTLAWATEYQMCADAKSVSGQAARNCSSFAIGARPDRCVSPVADTVGTVVVIIDFVPNDPNEGVVIDGDRGLNCDGTAFTNERGSGGISLLMHDGRMSHRWTYRIKPNLPGGSKRIVLRWPKLNQGKYLGDASPDNGQFYVNGTLITRVSDPFETAPLFNFIPTAAGIAFDLTVDGDAS